MPSSWHASSSDSQMNVFSNDITTALDYTLRYVDVKIRLSTWYLSCTMTFSALLQSQKYGVELKDLVFGFSFRWWLISGTSPAWEILKLSQLQSNEVRMDPALSSSHFIIPAPSAAKIIIRLYNHDMLKWIQQFQVHILIVNCLQWTVTAFMRC